MKVFLIILCVISCIDAFVFYCVLVVGKRADERMYHIESSQFENDNR